MAKQALVLGLGQFGMPLARALTSRGVEVLAVDKDPKVIQQAAEFAAEAVSFDTTDEAALARTSPKDRDVAVVAIGQEARDSSIVTCALLKQQGAPLIVARANDPIHERILYLVGAHEVVNPEQAFGERLANRLAYRGVIDQLPLGEDLMLTELETPARLVGRTLSETALPRRFGVTVVGIRTTEDGKSRVAPPDPRSPLAEDDILIVAASPHAIEKMLEQL